MAPTVAGEPLRIGAGFEHATPRQSVQFMVSERITGIDEARAAWRRGAFQQLPSDGTVGATDASVWARVALELEPGAPRAYVLEIEHTNLSRVEAYLPGTDGDMQRRTYVRRAGPESLPMTTRYPTFEFSGDGKATYAVYLRVRSKGGLQLPLVLWERSSYFESRQHEQYLLGGYYGGLVALFLYNLVVLLVVRDRNYLYYLFALASVGLLNLDLNGLGYLYLWHALPGVDLALDMGLPALMVVAVTQFARHFLDVRRQLPRIHWGLVALQVWSAALAAAAFVLPQATVWPFVLWTVLVFVVGVFAVGGWLLLGGLRQARFFMLGWSFLLAGAMVTALSAMGVLPWNLFTNFALQLGSGLEMVLLSTALADRLRILSDEAERDLEDRVAERTSQLDAALVELQSSNEELLEQSLSDELTGLANRRGIDRGLRREWLRARRADSSIGLVLIDIDHFKTVNDRYGHAVGDEILAEVGQRLREVARRPDDLVARYGGEELLLIVPGVDAEGLRAIADRAFAAIRDEPVHTEAGPVSVTASIGGVVVAPGATELNPVGAVEAADRALYRAKREGRDRIAV